MFNPFASVLHEEVKTPVEPKKLSRAEMADLCKNLTYAVSGMYTSHVDNSRKRKGKGRKGKGGEMAHFPSPQRASMLNKVYHVFQTADLGAISSNVTTVTGAINFGFVQLNQAAALTAVFDQYRLAMVEVTFLPQISIVTATIASPLFYTTVDLDDSTPVSITALQDYPGCQETISIKQHKHTFTPHIAVAAYSGAFTSFANESAPWIDVASPSVQHYGVKYGFAADPTGQSYGYNIRVRYHFMFRNVR